MTGVQQVGGEHYKADYQHWDLCIDCDVPYLEAAATKYICRWNKKNGIQDLEKGISYLEKIIESFNQKRYRNTSLFSSSFHAAKTHFSKWVRMAQITSWEEVTCQHVFTWETPQDLYYVIEQTRTRIAALRGGGQATPQATPVEPASARPTVGQGTEHPAPFGYSAADEVPYTGEIL